MGYHQTDESDGTGNGHRGAGQDQYRQRAEKADLSCFSPEPNGHFFSETQDRDGPGHEKGYDQARQGIGEKQPDLGGTDAGNPSGIPEGQILRKLKAHCQSLADRVEHGSDGGSHESQL